MEIRFECPFPKDYHRNHNGIEYVYVMLNFLFWFNLFKKLVLLGNDIFFKSLTNYIKIS